MSSARVKGGIGQRNIIKEKSAESFRLGRYRWRLLEPGNVVPVFYACDNAYVKYLLVSIKSLVLHASFIRRYEIIILHEDLTLGNMVRIRQLEEWNVRISFADVSEYMKEMEGDISLRDYYSKTTYYRIFIPRIYPEFAKAVYLDGDTVLLSDVARLYDMDLAGKYVGAVQDKLIACDKVFNTYSEQALGIPGFFYFNAGVLVLNCVQFRRHHLERRFLSLLKKYSFVVAQDQDYLNVICKGRVCFLPFSWNRQMYGEVGKDEEIHIIHYNLEDKPWNKKDCRLGEYFWQYASLTDYGNALKQELKCFAKQNEARNKACRENLVKLAEHESCRPDNYRRKYAGRDYLYESRLAVQDKIRKLEREKNYNIDVEDDPESPVLNDYEIEYLKKSRSELFHRKVAFYMAGKYRDSMKRRNQFYIRNIIGMKNIRLLESGAVITCNHFNPMDSFAVQEVFDQSAQKKHLYRVIREGNYTNFPGFFGFLMRNCDTLPLSSSRATMRKFMEAADSILTRGDFILVYPEQSMWWNYRSPRPLKKGAFILASRNRVPVLPVFITMENLTYADRYGFPVQAYTIHVGNPIYPDADLSHGAQVQKMMGENEAFWKRTYENFYRVGE